MVNVPSINLPVAIRLFYEKNELSNADIVAIFDNKIGSTRLKGLKKLARTKMVELNTLNWDSKCVNTENAFEAWGLDIEKLEKKYAKLCKLGFMQRGDTTIRLPGGQTGNAEH